MPNSTNSSPTKKKTFNRVVLMVSGPILVILVILICYSLIIVIRPVPRVKVQNVAYNLNLIPASSLKLSWPIPGESAVGVLGSSVIQTHGVQNPIPTASIAKLVTALAVLNRDPLSLNSDGPEFTVNQADVNDYNTFLAEDGSVVKVEVGEQISEYQALQAMLLPSANNIADSLASWVFGSSSNYVTFANNYLKTLGLSQTTIADPSGFSPSTVSTASDIVKLGEISLNNPVIAQIVNQKSAALPVAGTVSNVNFFLGDYGIIGIKTGNTDQAGGCYLAAAKYDLPDSQSMTIISAVMGAPTLQAALNESVPLLESVHDQIGTLTVPSGTVLEDYSTVWGNSGNIVTKGSMTVSYLPGMNIAIDNSSSPLDLPIQSNDIVGSSRLSLESSGSSTELIVPHSLPKPSITWRLLHPRYFF